MDSERYVLTCHRYIELNPVRAAMATTPEAYRWSSYHHNALGHDDPLLTPHPEYLVLGTNIDQRKQAYRTLFENAISNERLTEIHTYLQQQRVLGTPRFQTHIEAMLGRRAKSL